MLNKQGHQQLPMGFLVPESSWKAPDLSQLPQDWNVYKRISIDTETKDSQLLTLGIGVRRGGYIVGYTLSFEDGSDAPPTFYLPIRHAGGGNLDPKAVKAYIRDNALKFTGELVGAHLAYDLDYMAEIDVHFPNVSWFRDVNIADPIINELEFSYNLDTIGKRRVGIGKDEELLFNAAQAYGAKTPSDVKNILWTLPAHLVGPYGEGDGWLPLKILRVQEKIIQEEGLQKAWDLESKVLPALVRMRRRGLPINMDKLTKIERWSIEEERKTLIEVHSLTGVKIEVGETMQVDLVARALRAVGIEPPMTKTKKSSVTKELLESINHPVGKLIRHGRQMAKVRSTYVDNMRAHEIRGRIHCTFNQLVRDKDDDHGIEGAITARLSCCDPNLQNQFGEAAGELGAQWRDIFEPERGAEYVVKDYSQQEPRWLVHWAVLAGKRRIGEIAHNAALAFAERYKNDPTTDFHDMTASFIDADYVKWVIEQKDLAKKKRKASKIVGLARIYGRGGASTCRQLGLPTIFKQKEWNNKRSTFEAAGEEGQAILDRFDSAVPFAKEMLKADTKQGRRLGYVRTWSERKLRALKDKEGNYDFLHTMLNKRIQGSSADQTKVALVELDRAGYHIHIQIHDEIDSSAQSHDEARKMAEIMENCVPMKVPSKVDLEVGSSWGTTKKLH